MVVIGIILFLLATIMGAIWWGWWGLLIGFVAWVFIWGTWLLVRDVSDAGEAARKSRGEK